MTAVVVYVCICDVQREMGPTRVSEGSGSGSAVSMVRPPVVGCVCSFALAFLRLVVVPLPDTCDELALPAAGCVTVGDY